MKRRLALQPLLAACTLVTVAACERSGAPSTPLPTTPAQGVEAAPEAARPAAAPATAPADDVIGFGGFGPARFGDAEESVRIAWGSELLAVGTSDECRQLFTHPPSPAPAPRVLWFMLVDGKFARYDVDSPKYRAPGGIAVGDPASRVTEVHAGRVESAPHKYVEGARTLTVTPADGGTARLVFETTADGTIERWRIGVPPAVFFVEGCS